MLYSFINTDMKSASVNILDFLIWENISYPEKRNNENLLGIFCFIVYLNTFAIVILISFLLNFCTELAELHHGHVLYNRDCKASHLDCNHLRSTYSKHGQYDRLQYVLPI